MQKGFVPLWPANGGAPIHVRAETAPGLVERGWLEKEPAAEAPAKPAAEAPAKPETPARKPKAPAADTETPETETKE